MSGPIVHEEHCHREPVTWIVFDGENTSDARLTQAIACLQAAQDRLAKVANEVATGPAQRRLWLDRIDRMQALRDELKAVRR